MGKAYLIDSQAQHFAKTSKFLPRDVVKALYPSRIPKRLNYIFRHNTPLPMPEEEAVALLERHSCLRLTDSKGNDIEMEGDGYEYQLDFEIDLEKVKRAEIIQAIRRFREKVPFQATNKVLAGIVNDQIIAGKKPLTLESLKQYESDQEAIKKQRVEDFKARQSENLKTVIANIEE